MVERPARVTNGIGYPTQREVIFRIVDELDPTVLIPTVVVVRVVVPRERNQHQTLFVEQLHALFDVVLLLAKPAPLSAEVHAFQHHRVCEVRYVEQGRVQTVFVAVVVAYGVQAVTPWDHVIQEARDLEFAHLFRCCRVAQVQGEQRIHLLEGDHVAAVAVETHTLKRLGSGQFDLQMADLA